MQLSHIEGYTSTMKCDIEVLQSPDISSVNVNNTILYVYAIYGNYGFTSSQITCLKFVI